MRGEDAGFPAPALSDGKSRAPPAVSQDVTHPLDNPLWAALTGPQAHLAVRHGRAARYPADVRRSPPFPVRAGRGTTSRR